MRDNECNARASIIIPAHNEASVISRCLNAIFSTADPGEFEVLVVCNGCSDDSADIVRSSFPLARLVETSVASKVNALNLGDSAATQYPRIYLDADLAVTSDSLRELLKPLRSGEALAACGQMHIDTAHSSYFVKSFYSVWQKNSYLEGGKFGGLFAVSRIGHRRIAPFANVTNDDEMVRRSFCPSDRAYVPTCSFLMTAPQTLHGLIKIRTRAIRGTVEIEKLGYENTDGSAWKRFGRFFARIVRKPAVWLSLPTYLFVSGFIRAKVAVSNTDYNGIWERDDSSREWVQ